jgi:pimeloyl-ACP methyl ester carboxylesterase
LVPFGGLRLVHDANNDTTLDDGDELALDSDPTAIFAFWEADERHRLNITGAADGDRSSTVPPSDTLADFFRVELRVTAPWPSSGVRLRFSGDQLDWSFTVAPQIGEGSDYVVDPTTAQRQLAELRDILNAFGESDAGVPLGNTLRLKAQESGNHSFLIRCNRCGQESRRQLIVEYEQAGEVVVLDSVEVDIRSIREWTSAYTARQPDTDVPRSQLELELGWAPLPAQTSQTRPNVTLLVHGFNVGHQSALENFIPTAAKRLYWGGHPILPRQRDYHHVVGVTWTGDVVMGLARHPGLFFIEDEFRALQTGIPLSRFLAQVRERYPNSRVTVVAHSLGNMVVNSALTRLPVGTVDTTVMVNAAVTSEAFDGAYSPSDVDRVGFIEGIGGAESAGFPSDAMWEREWQEILNNPDTPCQDCPVELPPYREWKQYVTEWLGPEVAASDDSLGQLYARRWRTGIGQSPWRGLFASNRQRTKLVNFFNSTDQVFRVGDSIPFIWQSSQLFQKPSAGGTGYIGLSEGLERRFWRTLPHQTAENIAVLGGISATEMRAWPELAHWFREPNALPALTNEPSSVVRRWAELAFWFQTVASAAGNTSLTPAGVFSCDYTAVGGANGNPLSLTSHTYLTNLHSWQTAPLYDAIARQVAGDAAACGGVER